MLTWLPCRMTCPTCGHRTRIATASWMRCGSPAVRAGSAPRNSTPGWRARCQPGRSPNWPGSPPTCRPRPPAPSLKPARIVAPGSGASPQAEREHGQCAQHYQPGHQASQPAEHRRDHHQDRQQYDGQDRRLSTDLCSRNTRPHTPRIALMFDIRQSASIFQPAGHDLIAPPAVVTRAQQQPISISSESPQGTAC